MEIRQDLTLHVTEFVEGDKILLVGQLEASVPGTDWMYVACCVVVFQVGRSRS